MNPSLVTRHRELSLLAKSNCPPTLFCGRTVMLPRITPDDVRQLTFSTAIVHKSYVALILLGPHLDSDVPFRVNSMALL